MTKGEMSIHITWSICIDQIVHLHILWSIDIVYYGLVYYGLKPLIPYIILQTGVLHDTVE